MAAKVKAANVTVVDVDDLMKLAKQFNKAKLSEEALEIDEEGDFGESVEKFLEAVEGVSEDDEEKIPTEVADKYNDIVDEMEGKKAPAKKESKKAEPKKVAKEEPKEKGKKKKVEEEEEEEEEAPAAKSKKAVEKKAEKKVTKKVAAVEGPDSGMYREGSSAYIIYQGIAAAGKKGLTFDEAVKDLKKKFESSNPEGRIRTVLKGATKRELITMKGDRYFASKK